jgi:hypothetical protein
MNEDETYFTWNEPEAFISRRGGSPVYALIAGQLRDNPMQWAELKDLKHPTFRDSINSGKLKAFRPKGDFEAVCRAPHEPEAQGLCRVFVRYVGQE